MPIPVSEAVYTKNTLRITFRVFNWEDLLVSADEIYLTVVKVEKDELVPLPQWTKVAPSYLGAFREIEGGVYQALLDTTYMTDGEYYAIFEGKVDGASFYEPIPFKLKTLRQEVKSRR